jgi:hypothetical protein
MKEGKTKFKRKTLQYISVLGSIGTDILITRNGVLKDREKGEPIHLKYQYR